MLQMMNSPFDLEITSAEEDEEGDALLIGSLDATPKLSLSSILRSSVPISEVWQQRGPDHSR